MEDSKLFRILRTFTKNEFKLFEKFVNSPYFSSGRDVTGLLTVLKNYYPEFKTEYTGGAALHKELFQNAAYNEKRIKNLIIELTKMADKFLIVNRFLKDENKKDNLLAYEYKERNLEKYFAHSLKFIESKIARSPFNSFESFTKEEELEKLNQEYFVNINKWVKVVESKNRYSEYFILTFLIRYLRILREKHVAESAYNTFYGNEALDALLETFNAERLVNILIEKNYKHSYLLAIYFHGLKALENSASNEHYMKFKSLALEHLDKFSHTEKYMLFSDMVTYCIEKDRLKPGSFIEEEFSLYKDMIRHNVYSWTENEYMQIVTFRNIMITSLELKEYMWLEEFTLNYSDRLKPEYRDNMKNLVLANIRYAEGRFEEALAFIQKVKYDVFLYKVDVRNLAMKIFYELDMFEQAFYSIDSYRHFLANTHELSEYFKVQNINFVNLFAKILKVKADGNFEELELTIKEINSTDPLSSRNWLLNKTEEIIKKGAGQPDSF